MSLYRCDLCKSENIRLICTNGKYEIRCNECDNGFSKELELIEIGWVVNQITNYRLNNKESEL